MSAPLFADAEPVPGWALEWPAFDVAQNRHYEALFTMGGGLLNVRASLPEGLTDDPQDVTFLRTPGNVTIETFRTAKSKWGTYVPGFMDRHPLLNEQMVNLPFPLGLAVWADGEKLDMEHSRLSAFAYWLDLRDGCVHRRVRWLTQTGAELEVAFHQYVHLPAQLVLWQCVDVAIERGRAEVRVEPFLDGNVRTNGYDHFARCATWGRNEGVLGISVELADGRAAAVCARVAGATRWQVMQRGRRVALRCTRQLSQGATWRVTKVTAVVTCLDARQPRRAALAAVTRACAAGDEACYAEHRALWDALWARADVRIEGDEASQRALRASLYHLLRAHPRHPRAAIDAKANGGDAYWGRIHWDSELFIAPFFIYCVPEWARLLLTYRATTLPGARRNAARLGYPGARFAWESGSSGAEECPSFQYADHEIHISSDVVLALWHYLCATRDQEFLRSVAAEIIFEVARYWRARIDHLPGSPHAHLLCVMGPDEYAHAADDNAYTNFTAAYALTIAAHLYATRQNEPALARLAQRLRLTAREAREWRRLANTLLIPYSPEHKVILQSADFLSKAPIDFKVYWKDRRKPFGCFVAQERLYRSRALKQADVLLMMQLFPKDFSDEMVARALAFYEPYTTHDSSLSVSTHAIIATRLGLARKAWQYFVTARDMDVGAGRDAAEGIHAANAGALWQCVVFGFLGMLPAYQSDVLSLRPRLPRGWKACALELSWQGVRVQLRVTQKHVELTPEAPLSVEINGTPRRCPRGVTTRVPLIRTTRRQKPVTQT
ncbi:MAG: hypothetical protein N2595_07090 [bacterium]|nr:hypothetical protein [bacterium]